MESEVSVSSDWLSTGMVWVSQFLASHTAAEGFEWTPCCGLLIYNHQSPVWSKSSFPSGSERPENCQIPLSHIYLCSYPLSCWWSIGQGRHRYCFSNFPSFGIWGFESDEYQLKNWNQKRITFIVFHTFSPTVFSHSFQSQFFQFTLCWDRTLTKISQYETT